ncbi:hypothetical protein AXK11_05855 [Cephaloticoccus primus]|uniref:Transporter n=1 Tax=Cephaloticoccus primus TaxID=1548207 RepID=A0A139SLZ1_9BACT|nr:TolC family protein [Cephaloticoccus primus]KXU35520.1 hypothetical protein AXK11_05855 [Cephaloticoccus primus]
MHRRYRPLAQLPSLCALALSLTLALPHKALAQAAAAATTTQAGAASEPLSLQACIDRALQKNFGLAIQRFDAANSREALTIARADYDPALTLTTGKSVNQSDNPDTSLVGTRNDTFSARAGVTQKVATGATLSLTQSLNRRGTNNNFALLNPAYNADLSLSVSQPLLRGAGTRVNLAPIRRAEIGLEIASLNTTSRVLQVVRDTEAAYYALVYARESLKVRTQSLDLAQRLYDENTTRLRTGVVTDLDVLQAEVGVENARRSVLVAQQSVRDAEDRLLNLIGQFEFDQALGTVALPPTATFSPDFELSYALARKQQPEYRSAAEQIKQLQLDLATARRNRLPSLDLNVAGGYNTRDSTLGRTYNRLPDGDGYTWQIDLALRMPWGLRAEKARYNTALNNLRREETRLRQIEQNLALEVRSAVRAVETNLETVTISRKATELSARQYELERARFDAGLSTSRRVLEAQDDLETARVAELQSQVNLRTAMAELNRIDGTSLALYNIELPAN